MSKLAPLFTGDDWAIPLTIKKNGLALDISTATITACVGFVEGRVGQPLTPSVAQSSGAAGADWATGQLVVEFPLATTGTIKRYGALFIEITITLGGVRKTWPRYTIEVYKGLND